MSTIALLHPAFTTPGGAEILCVEEARYLQSQGEMVSLVTLGFDRSRWGSRLDGIPVLVAQKRRWTDLFSGVSRLAKLRARSRRVAPMLADFDVVVAHNFPCNSMLGASDSRFRRVWQCNEPPRRLHARAANPRITGHVEQSAVGNDLSSRLWNDVLRKYKTSSAPGGSLFERIRFDIEQTSKVDHIFAISEFSRDNARSIYGRCGEEVVYPMVRFNGAAKARSGLDRSGLHVLVHGRLETMKNIDGVIRGFALFESNHPGSHLNIVGDGPIRRSLEDIAGETLPRGAYTFHGYLPEAGLVEVYEHCDVMALLTLDEPFGMVFPEAAAKGLLLIGPDHGGPFEILEGGRLGWCIDPFAPQALAQALEEVWSLPDAEVDRRREEADRACRARFSESVIGPQLRRVILHGQD